MKTKNFTLRTLLTVTTHRLLTEPESDGDNGIGKLYKILGWMTGEELFTTQIPRFGRECEPYLLRWFPELVPVSAELKSLDAWIRKSNDGPETGVRMWVTEMQLMFPALKPTYDVPRIPNSIDPVEELRGQIGDGKIVVVNLDGADEGSSAAGSPTGQ